MWYWTFGCSVPPHLHHSRQDKVHWKRKCWQEAQNSFHADNGQADRTYRKDRAAGVIKTYKPQLTEEANMERFFTVFNYREKMVRQIKPDGGRFRAKKKELILHIIYNFCITHIGSLCHKMLLLRNVLRHKFLTTGAVFWERPWQAICVSDSSLTICCSPPLDIWY